MAEPVGMDFGQAVQSAAAINQWVGEQTNNKIQKIITPESLGPLTKLVLVNAIYFKGDWEVKFDKSKTSKGDFHVSPTKTVKTDMMFCNEEYGYVYNLVRKHTMSNSRVVENLQIFCLLKNSFISREHL